MSNAIKRTKASLLSLLLVTSSALAEPVDLSGAWLLHGEQGAQYRMQMTRIQGHSWSGITEAKSPFTLKLHPSDLRNEWVGDLTLQKRHGVKASLVDPKTLRIQELSGSGVWNLKRPEE